MNWVHGREHFLGRDSFEHLDVLELLFGFLSRRIPPTSWSCVGAVLDCVLRSRFANPERSTDTCQGAAVDFAFIKFLASIGIFRV